MRNVQYLFSYQTAFIKPCLFQICINEDNFLHFKTKLFFLLSFKNYNTVTQFGFHKPGCHSCFHNIHSGLNIGGHYEHRNTVAESFRYKKDEVNGKRVNYGPHKYT